MPLFETPEPIDVELDVPVGDVLVVASDRQDTLVEVRPARAGRRADEESAQAARVEHVDGRISVHVPRSWRSLSFISSGPMVDVVVHCPTGSGLKADSSWATFRTEGRLGDVTLRTGAGVNVEEATGLDVECSHGDVSVRRASGPTRITSSNGRIRVEHLDGPGELKNSNGDIWVGVAGPGAGLRNSTGSIDVEHALGALRARSAYGAVRVAEVVAGAVDLANSYGSVDVGVRAGSAVWLDLDSTHGRVHQGLTPSDAPESGDAVELRVATTYGDITVHRA